MSAMVPALVGMPHYNSDGYGSHLYVPWWGWDKHRTLNFPRGYHIEVGGGYGMPGIGSFTGIVNRPEGYGVAMKQAIRDEYGTSISLSGRGEMIPNEQSFCEIDPDVKDRWGIPGAALPLEVERPRAESGPPHAADLPRHPRRHGRPDRDGGRGGGRGAAGGPAQVGQRAGGQAPQTGQAGPRRARPTRPRGSRRRWDSRRQPTAACPSHAAAPSFTRSAPCGWATIRRRAR